MKNLFYLFLFALLFTACDKDETKPTKGKLNPDAMILVRPDESMLLKSTINGLTPEEIVRDAYYMRFTTHWGPFGYSDEAKTLERGFPDHFKDYENNILKFQSTDIITAEGELLNDFLKSFDIFIMNELSDTIAYIPNKVLRDAEPLIEAAFEAEDFDEVYRLFDEAYTYKAFD